MRENKFNPLAGSIILGAQGRRLGEASNLISASGGALGVGMSVEEFIKAQGRYAFKAVGPRENVRHKYLHMRSIMHDAMRQNPFKALSSDIYVPHLDASVEVPVDPVLRDWMIELLEPKWDEPHCNTVMTLGKNDLLDKYLAGSSYTAAFFLGLISSTSYSAISAADTSSSHAGWLEAGTANNPTYSQSTRPAPSWAAASAGSKASNANIVFSITSTGTAKGGFLITVSTKDGTTGVLFSAGLFTQGDRAVVNGDTINGSYTLSV